MVKKSLKLKALIVGLLLFSTQINAQELSADSLHIYVDDLPEYIIIISEIATSFGGILLVIQNKGSEHENALSQLESLLTDRDKLNLKNQMDILNYMSKLGFEFIDAYTSSQSSINRTSMVFRKKMKYRN